MTDQTTPEINTPFIPPAARNLPLAALDSATRGADMLDARATTPSGRNFLAHALVQMARDGWLRIEPGAGFEPVDDEPSAPTPPQDGPQAPQDGPEPREAGTESPEGLNGGQAGAEPPAPYRQLLARLQQERAKSLRNAPRCDLEEARWVNEGIAAGIRIAEAWAVTLHEGHDARLAHLAGEARTTPDNPATSSDTADNPLREQYAGVIAELPYYERDDAGLIADAALAVRDREMEQLRARIVTLEHVAAGNKRHVQLIVPDLERAAATVERVRSECDRLEAAVHANPTSPDFDGAYLAAIRHIRAALQPAAPLEPAGTGEGQ